MLPQVMTGLEITSLVVTSSILSALCIGALFLFISFVLYAIIYYWQVANDPSVLRNRLKRDGTLVPKRTDKQFQLITSIQLGGANPNHEWIVHSLDDSKEDATIGNENSNRRSSRFFEENKISKKNKTVDSKAVERRKTTIMLNTPVRPHDNNAIEPIEWEEYFSEDYQRPYWVNINTRETVWILPFGARAKKINLLNHEEEDDKDNVNAIIDNFREPGDPWLVKYSNKFSRQYWIHETTGEKRWKNPQKKLKSKGVKRA